jgi:hypothetical protein
MKANRQLPSRAQGDARRDGVPRTGGDCFDHFQRLKHFEEGEIENRVTAMIETMKDKRVYRMKKRGRG